jgi:hypothetical protein
MLRINYRTSHQIWVQADRLLRSSIADVDGNEVRPPRHDLGIRWSGAASSRPDGGKVGWRS